MIVIGNLKVMNEEWKLEEDGSCINSIQSVLIPWLGYKVETFIEIEDNQTWFTKLQEDTINNFLSLNQDNKELLASKIRLFYQKALAQNRIKSEHFDNIYDAIDWNKTLLCIPQLYDSINQYVLLLPDTKWKLVDSEFNLELEILFTNGTVEIIQEMSGLWNRLEWFDAYLKRKTPLLFEQVSDLEYQECNLNIDYKLPDTTWDKVSDVYEKMDGWLGFGENGNGETGIPYWFSYNESEKYILASSERSGLLIVGNMSDNDWDNWISDFKKIATEILGFKVGEKELGEVTEEIEWIKE